MNEFQNFKFPFHTSWLQGAADINSTIVDLFNFMKALENGTLLKGASKNMLYNATQAMGVNAMLSGLGWVIDQKKGRNGYITTGCFPGYASVMGSLPEKTLK